MKADISITDSSAKPNTNPIKPKSPSNQINDMGKEKGSRKNQPLFFNEESQSPKNHLPPFEMGNNEISQGSIWPWN